jgi:hypothetical protein
MHRLQSIYISRKSFVTTPTTFIHNPPYATICPHIKLRASMHNIGFGAGRCQDCRTEYRIDFKFYDGKGLVMFLTRWKDLGDGPESEV